MDSAEQFCRTIEWGGGFPLIGMKHGFSGKGKLVSGIETGGSGLLFQGQESGCKVPCLSAGGAFSTVFNLFFYFISLQTKSINPSHVSSILSV